MIDLTEKNNQQLLYAAHNIFHKYGDYTGHSLTRKAYHNTQLGSNWKESMHDWAFETHWLLIDQYIWMETNHHQPKQIDKLPSFSALFGSYFDGSTHLCTTTA